MDEVDRPADHRPPRRGTAEAILVQAAGWLLPGAPDIDPPADPVEAARLVDHARLRGLLGPLLVCVDAGALELPEPERERLVEAHRAALLWCMHLEHRLLDLADWFDLAGGVRYLVVKGPAVAHLDEPDPSLRSYGDLDLLVAAEDLDRALSTLEARGAERRVPARRPGFDRRFVKSVGLVCDDDVELDVHRSLVDGPHGFRIPIGRFFDHPDHFDVGGRAFAAPERRIRALHACYHAVVGSAEPPLRTVRDLAGYLSELGPEVLVPEAERWRGQAVLWSAVVTTFATITFDSPAWRDWAAATRPDPRELDVIRRGRRPSPWPIQWSILREIPVRDRPAYVWGVVAPSPQHLEGRGLTPAQRLAAGVRGLTGSSSRRR